MENSSKLKIVYLQEEKYYSNENIKIILRDEGIYLKNLSDFFDKLQNKNIIKKIENEMYKLTYVGLLILNIEYENFIIVVLPKYLNFKELTKEDKKKQARQLIQLLKRYSEEPNKTLNKEELETIGDNFDSNSFNLISLINYIIADYIEYGLYSSEYSDYELNGNGEINWQKTIEENNAYISNKQVFYLDYFTIVSEYDEKDYIRNLHKMILNKCSDFIDSIEIFDILNYPKISFAVDEISLGNKAFMLKKIENEMSLQFSERKLRVLKTIHHFIQQNNIISHDNKIILYGLKSFYDVWEKACSYILENEYESYKDKIVKPIWKSIDNNKINTEDKFIPDILKKINDNFYIFDAKYYNFSFKDDGTLIGSYPGVNDVIKQYAYELALKCVPELENCNFKNFFIIPSVLTEDKIIGSVELPIFKGIDSIKILRLNAECVFKNYIENKRYDFTFLSAKTASQF